MDATEVTGNVDGYVQSMKEWKDRIIKLAVADDVDLTTPLPDALHILDSLVMEQAYIYMSGAAVFYRFVCVCGVG